MSDINPKAVEEILTIRITEHEERIDDLAMRVCALEDWTDIASQEPPRDLDDNELEALSKRLFTQAQTMSDSAPLRRHTAEWWHAIDNLRSASMHALSACYWLRRDAIAATPHEPISNDKETQS